MFFQKKPNNDQVPGRVAPVPLAIKIKDPEMLRILENEEAEQLLSNFKVFRDSCTELILDFWRLSKLISKLKNPEALTVLNDTIARFGDTLVKHGFEVKDMIGQAYNEGLVVDVIHIEESNDPNLKGAFISETIRPAIYLKNRLLQKSEVIVTKPAAI